MNMRWSSADAEVAAVDELTGRITAEAEGQTTVVGEDLGPYGIGPVSIPVAVRP